MVENFLFFVLGVNLGLMLAMLGLPRRAKPQNIRLPKLRRKKINLEDIGPRPKGQKKERK